MQDYCHASSAKFLLNNDKTCRTPHGATNDNARLARHIYNSGAARDATGALPYKKKSGCSAFTARLTSGVKATLRMARNTAATTLVLTIIMTIFIVVIHQLGWIATHQKPPIME